MTVCQVQKSNISLYLFQGEVIEKESKCLRVFSLRIFSSMKLAREMIWGMRWKEDGTSSHSSYLRSKNRPFEAIQRPFERNYQAYKQRNRITKLFFPMACYPKSGLQILWRSSERSSWLHSHLLHPPCSPPCTDPLHHHQWPRDPFDHYLNHSITFFYLIYYLMIYHHSHYNRRSSSRSANQCWEISSISHHCCHIHDDTSQVRCEEAQVWSEGGKRGERAKRCKGCRVAERTSHPSHPTPPYSLATFLILLHIVPWSHLCSVLLCPVIPSDGISN